MAGNPLHTVGLLLGVAAGGVAMLTPRAPMPPALQAKHPADPPKADGKPAARVDRHGDPLPPGAITRLGTLRFRAPGEIVSLAFAPNGKTLAISAHGGLFLMDAASGKRAKRLPTVTDSTLGTLSTEAPIVFSPDGKSLISGGHKAVGHSLLPVVRVWDLTGERKPREHDIGSWIRWVGWSAEGQPLAIRVEDNGTLHLHELSAGRSRHFACTKPYKEPSGVISRDPPVACSPKGHALAVADAENVIHVWDTAAGRERCSFQPKRDSIYTLTFSPDGSRLVATTSKDVQMWSAVKGKVVYTVENADANYSCPVFSLDGKTLAIAKSWQTIRFWDAVTGKERGCTRDKDDFSPHFALSVDGKLLVAAARHGSTFRVWDVATGKKHTAPVGHQSRPHGAVFLPDGRRVATGGGLDGTIQFWDQATGEPLMRIHRPGWLRDIALSLDGRSLFSTWTDENLWISDASTGKRRHIIKLEDPDRPNTRQSAISMRQSDDGKTLIAFSYYYPKKNGAGPRYQDTLITGWDAATHEQLFRRRRSGMDSWIALSADARLLAVPHAEDRRERGPGRGPMRLEDLRTGELLLTFPALEGQTWPLAFSPDGRLLASNNYNGQRTGKDGQSKTIVQLWETATAAEVLSLPGAGSNNRVAFSPDGRLLALTAPAQEILIWDRMLGCEWRRFKGFDAEVTHLAFSPDGRRLLSGLSDSTLLVWDVGAPKAASRNLDADAGAKAWTDLASTNAPRAFRAREALAAAPAEAMALLKERLHPAKAADPRQLRRLLSDLESEQFAVREKAQKELTELGDLAEPALRRTLANKPTLEVRHRVQAVLERLRGPVKQPELLRALRAVAVLEDIGTAPARRLLEELTKGATESRLTREAKASLRRLDSRKPYPPGS